MSFMGTVGSVAQAAYAVAGGATDVSIATTSGTGNYDNAVIISLTPTGSSGQQALASNDGSDFSGGSGAIDLSYGPNYNAQVLAGSGVLSFFTKAFCRATAPAGGNIDSYIWDLDSPSNSISTAGGNPVATQSFSGSPLNGSGEEGANDATGSTGVGEKVGVTHASGGRGYLLMGVGDHIQWKCQCQVSAGGVDVDASEITIKIEVV